MVHYQRRWRFIVGIVLLPLLISSFADAFRKDVPLKVFLFAGQSNMQGQGRDAHLFELINNPETAGLYRKFRALDGTWAVQPNVWVRYNQADDSIPNRRSGRLTMGFGERGNRFGPELEFGFRIGEIFEDEPILFIKCNWGGVSLAVDFRPPSAPPTDHQYLDIDNTGIRYNETIQIVNETLSDLSRWVPGYNTSLGYEMMALLWFQGFNDVVDPRKLGEYESNLNHLIQDFRKDLNDPFLPMMIGELGMAGITHDYDSHHFMRHIQRKIASNVRNARYIRTAQFVIDNQERYDGQYHYYGRADTFINIGRAFAEPYFPEPTASPLPSFAPSGRPSISPSTSLQPSRAPSTSMMPSFLPSSLPSSNPTTASPSTSVRPSPTPTASPQPSPTPTTANPSLSPLPSLNPSLSAPPSMFPSLQPSASLVPTGPSSMPSLSRMPSEQPSSEPTSDGICDDDITTKFFVEETGEMQGCIWLASRPSYHESLCVEGKALDICEETCGKCTDLCFEDPNTVITVYGISRNCLWLNIRYYLHSLICVKTEEAYTKCPETCNTCENYSMVPSSIPTTSAPSMVPSGLASSSPLSSFPSTPPSTLPSMQPSVVSSTVPTQSLSPSAGPSTLPTRQSLLPSTSPSSFTSIMPTQSLIPSTLPSEAPSSVPTKSLIPSTLPSTPPTQMSTPLSSVLSAFPSERPKQSLSGSSSPSGVLFLMPGQSESASISPSTLSSSLPTRSLSPSMLPSELPSSVPMQSLLPSTLPSAEPSDLPTQTPLPSTLPSMPPSVVPTQSLSPSRLPSELPSTIPTDSTSPTLRPSLTTYPSMSVMPTRNKRPFFCFSGHNTVTERTKGELQMKDLKLGDEVLVNDGKFERVYSFGHRHETKPVPYLKIHTSMNKTLEITADHMIFMGNGTAVPASLLRVNQRVQMGNGLSTQIQSIESIVKDGMYGPFTASGTIIVSGIAASCFVALQDSPFLTFGSIRTSLTYHALAHAFEAPHRWFCMLGQTFCTREVYTTEGVSWWVYLPMKIASLFFR